MTRITVGEFKNAVRNPRSRRKPPSDNGGFATPYPVASSAIRRFHREGEDAARNYMREAFRRSEYWGPNGKAQPRGWAKSIRDSFENYAILASNDTRPVLPQTVASNVDIGVNTIGVSLDVVLLDLQGYVGRYILWDKPDLQVSQAELISVPIVVALEQNFGEGRVVGIEVWHLQRQKTFFVHSVVALDRLTEVDAIISRYISN